MPGRIAEMNHRPRKRFGQHFLADASFLSKIVDAIAPQAGDTLVEIGPGLGALTRPLLDRLSQLHVVEIDRDLAAKLRAEFPADRLVVHEADALRFDFSSLPAPLRVAGNLPYNISTPLLFHVAQFADRIADMHFMLQKEVVDRMTAAPSTPDYGRLTVMLRSRFDMRRLFTVPPGAFRPPPKVDSAVVRMTPLRALPHPGVSTPRFEVLVTRAFGQRRKTLRNSLSELAQENDFAAAGIDPGLRAENLDVLAFARLAQAIAQGSP